MTCGVCGRGQQAMKTVRARTGGVRYTLCDPCWRPISATVWIVPGPVLCFGTCRSCGEWASVRDLRDAKPGGKWSAPAGTCATCYGEG